MSSVCAMYNGRKSSGFSLIELIAVITLLGIISVVALPRFYNTDAAAIQSARDQVLSAFFTAQQIAMARASSSNAVQVNVVESGLNVTENGSPAVANGGTYPLTLPEGVAITDGTGTYSFDKLGRTDPGQIVLTRGSTSATVRVEASGYVYTP